jgi:hypothetical protein
MEKIILLSLVCLSTKILAQKSFFGLESGFALANQRVHTEYYYQIINYNNPLQPHVSTSFFQNNLRNSYGFFYHLGLNDKIGIRFKAQHLGLGYKNPLGDPDHLEINYLCLASTFNYSITPTFTVGAGPYLSFTLGGTKINGQKITQIYHKNDNGLVFGAEYDFYKNFAISARYLFGLKNIWLNDKIGQPYVGAIGQTAYTNRALEFALIYKIKKPLIAK